MFNKLIFLSDYRATLASVYFYCRSPLATTNKKNNTVSTGAVDDKVITAPVDFIIAAAVAAAAVAAAAAAAVAAAAVAAVAAAAVAAAAVILF